MSKKAKIRLEPLKQKVEELLAELGGDFESFKQNEEWEMGIDEAGRGPVLGPLVYGCCLWPKRFKDQLSQLGFDDSKKLTEEERDVLFEIIEMMFEKLLYFEIKALSAEQISNKMLSVSSEQQNLNQLSFGCAYYLINSIMEKGFNVKNLYIDTVGSASTYKKKLDSDFNCQYPTLTFTVEEKADSKFPIVSAASICAKVSRDLQIREFKIEGPLNEKIPKEWGSGYPGDVNTKNWLKQIYDPIFGFPNLVRYSWSTVTNILNDNKLNIDFHEDEGNLIKNQPKISDLSISKIKQTYIEENLNLQSEQFSI